MHVCTIYYILQPKHPSTYPDGICAPTTSPVRCATRTEGPREAPSWISGAARDNEHMNHNVMFIGRKNERQQHLAKKHSSRIDNLSYLVMVVSLQCSAHTRCQGERLLAIVQNFVESYLRTVSNRTDKHVIRNLTCFTFSMINGIKKHNGYTHRCV